MRRKEGGVPLGRAIGEKSGNWGDLERRKGKSVEKSSGLKFLKSHTAAGGERDAYGGILGTELGKGGAEFYPKGRRRK